MHYDITQPHIHIWNDPDSNLSKEFVNMVAGLSNGAGMAPSAGTQDLIGTVSAISNSLMNEVSKVIIGKNENLIRVTVFI